jgi:hypothetical protein
VRGSATEPPPLSISLTFEDNMTAQADSRPGKNRKWHKEIAAQTTLRLEQPDLEVTGITRIFAVRGDSALIPRELRDRGFTADSTRWYIERIEDETVDAAGVVAGWHDGSLGPIPAQGDLGDGARPLLLAPEPEPDEEPRRSPALRFVRRGWPARATR